MNRPLPKQGHIRVGSTEYEQMCLRVLARDGWRCQNCGVAQSLQIHHMRFRSQGGDDSELNLITLCLDCHSMVHRCSHRQQR
jgi:5-methylcytosine-specific restriction endonuclease McrA